MAFRIDLQDVFFAIEEHLKIERLLASEHYRDTSLEDFRLMLEEGAKISSEVLWPTNTLGDRQGACFENGKVTLPHEIVEAYGKFTEAGWTGVAFPEEVGGTPVPHTIGFALSEMFTAGNCAFMMYPGLTRGVAALLLEYGNEQQRTLIPKLVSGEWLGTMCLTEPQAGSAVGDLSTVAEPEGDHYLLRGTKIFISAGEHDLGENILHLVLARTPGSPVGTKGISLFLVPKYLIDENGNPTTRNGVHCTGIEEKMGIHASATCVLELGGTERCVGYLVGQEHEGMPIMFYLMNEARMATGVQGLAIGAAAYHAALDYARERVQGTDIRSFKDPSAPRVPIVQHPDVRRMLLDQKAVVEGLRAMLLRAALWMDLAETSSEPQERERYGGLVDLITPIWKAFASDMGFRVTEWALQCFGGYGYIQDYPAEQFLRDVKIASIYEGTNGIQALDLVGRKLGRKRGKLVMDLMEDIDGFLQAEAGHPSLKDELKKLELLRERVLRTVVGFGSSSAAGDFVYPALSAVPLLHMFGHLISGWQLLEQAAEAEARLHALYFAEDAETPEDQLALLGRNEKAAFYHNKVLTARHYAHQFLPQAHALAESIESGDRSALEILF
jgi:alkylation response protein AidB-like acyl-CoA dehydrogenase